MEKKNELLDAQTYIWNHIFHLHNSMALKCAIQLGIPNTIHKHGKPISLAELSNLLPIHPTKTQFLPRLMRFLVQSNLFSEKKLSNGEEVYDLTKNSQLLLSDHPQNLIPFTLTMLDPAIVEPTQHLDKWFRNSDVSPFDTTHGKSLFEYAGSVPKFNEYFNKAMANDANFVTNILVTSDEFKGIIEGVETLVDVGGGTGAMCKAITDAFPAVKCIVFDLPHVVEGLQEDNGRNLVYAKGDMFETIPPTDAVLLKWILHDWSDDNCIKILKKCREAIPSKDRGGKLIIIDIVVDILNGNNHKNVQLLWDMQMLCHTIGGKERTEEEWKHLFFEAGFNDYKIFPILGPRSIIEVYPS